MYVKPKKRLGQNFLFDKNIQRKIIHFSELGPSDTVLEIGSGRGELTRLIAGNVSRLYSLELDADLAGMLADEFKDNPKVKIICADILGFNLNLRLKQAKGKIKVVGNIPYYITTAIIQHLLAYRKKINTIFITVQKEFARRISAPPGSKEYGSFSCFVQYYTRPKILFSVKKECFYPRPKVDSCFLRLDIRNNPAVKAQSEKLLFKIIRSAFNQRRKTLRNSLKGLVSLKKLDGFFEKYRLNRNIRPEMLALEDFAHLCNI